MRAPGSRVGLTFCASPPCCDRFASGRETPTHASHARRPCIWEWRADKSTQHPHPARPWLHRTAALLTAGLAGAVLLELSRAQQPVSVHMGETRSLCSQGLAPARVTLGGSLV